MGRLETGLRVLVSLSIIAALAYLVWRSHKWTREMFPDSIEVER